MMNESIQTPEIAYNEGETVKGMQIEDRHTGLSEFTYFEPEKRQIHAAFCSYCISNKRGPIIGKRFTCLICIGFDLCSQCESVDSHWHPMLRFTEPISNKNLETIKKNLINSDPYLYQLKLDYLRGYHNTPEEPQPSLETQLNNLSYT